MKCVAINWIYRSQATLQGSLLSTLLYHVNHTLDGSSDGLINYSIFICLEQYPLIKVDLKWSNQGVITFFSPARKGKSQLQLYSFFSYPNICVTEFLKRKLLWKYWHFLSLWLMYGIKLLKIDWFCLCLTCHSSNKRNAVLWFENI